MQVNSILYVVLLVLAHQSVVQAIWFPWYFYRFASRFGNRHPSVPAPKKNKQTVCPPGMRPKNSSMQICDDNPVLMQLARLYVVSPERIVLLLSEPSVQETCKEINDVVSQIRAVTSNCRMADDNIYRKLYEGLAYYKLEICDGGIGTTKKRCVGLNNAHDCLKELRSDLIECEAPAAWYEQRDSSKVCKSFNDILNCYYARAALLCGLDAAEQLRSFAGDSMQNALIYNCEVTKNLPQVDDPMPLKISNSANIQYGDE